MLFVWNVARKVSAEQAGQCSCRGMSRGASRRGGQTAAFQVDGVGPVPIMRTSAVPLRWDSLWSFEQGRDVT